MTEQMPTIRDLIKLMPLDRKSVQYGQSRTVLNYLDAQVLGYAVCFNSFIALFQTDKKYIKAVCYSTLHPFTHYGLAGFQNADIDKAIATIKNKKGFTESKLSENFEIIEAKKTV